MIRRAGPAERVVEVACVPDPCHISPATLRAMARRPWGNARKLPSGRWQARYQVQGRWRNAPETFRTKSLADSWLAATRTDLERGNWIDPSAGKVHLTAYAQGWLAARPELRPRTKENYRSLLKLHILPTLGQVELGDLSPASFASGAPFDRSDERVGVFDRGACLGGLPVRGITTEPTPAVVRSASMVESQ